MTQLNEPILEVRDVSFEYTSGLAPFRHSVRAVDGVSLELHRQDVLAVIGESGSGKTTLSKMLLALEQPKSGTVLLGGKSIGEWSRREIARRVQVVFQDPYSALNPRHSIGQILNRPLEIHGLGNAAERAKKTAQMLDVVGLSTRLVDSYPNHLSGGQRQRVVIARALMLRPDILVCDEPTSALDVSVQAQILNLLLDLRRDFGLSYVLISHNLAVVEHMATRIAIMYAGRVVEQGTPENIFRQPRHPYTRALLRSVITPDPRAGIPEVRMVRDGLREAPTKDGCHFYPRCSHAMPACRSDPPTQAREPGSFVECHLAHPAEAVMSGQVINLHSSQHPYQRET